MKPSQSFNRNELEQYGEVADKISALRQRGFELTHPESAKHSHFKRIISYFIFLLMLLSAHEAIATMELVCNPLSPMGEGKKLVLRIDSSGDKHFALVTRTFGGSSQKDEWEVKRKVVRLAPTKDPVSIVYVYGQQGARSFLLEIDTKSKFEYEMYHGSLAIYRDDSTEFRRRVECKFFYKQPRQLY